MKAQKLISQLSSIETILNDFSFEELNSGEAVHLKKSFQTFKTNLEDKIFQGQGTSEKMVDIAEKQEAINGKISQNAIMLVAKVSHEIRTPLNGIIGFADLLKEEGLTQGQLVQVDAIQTASYALMEIINELLEYSKLSAGLEHFESVDFNFKSVIGDVMYLCKTLIANKNVKLEAQIDADIPTVLQGDPSKLTQVLLNILGNSIKFVEHGEICLTARVKSRKGAINYLEFSIKDTGIGISEDQQKRIFETFKQAEPDTFTKYGGSGLGLSIVKQIIEKLGGGISVKSKLGVGTTFKFLIPYKKGNNASMIQEKESAKALKEQIKEVKNMSILVFEDNTLNQKLIETRLTNWGCNTFITDNAEYGIDILQNNKVDLVLMDLRMPGKDGFEVTKLIREIKDPEIRQIPVIALTADFTIQNKEQCEQYGIDDYILKPYAPDVLLSKLLKNKKEHSGSITIPENIQHTVSLDQERLKKGLSELLDDCMGEFEVLENLVLLYKQNALEFIGKACVCLKKNDMEQLAFAAHKIKSGLAMLRTDELLEIVVKIQDACKKGADKKHINTLYENFLTTYPKIEKTIDLEVQNLRNKSD